MISSIVLVGYLVERIDEYFRYIMVDTMDALHPEKCTKCKIPLLYWSRSSSNALTRKKKGTKVAIKGRIECDESIGLYVVVESMDTMSKE